MLLAQPHAEPTTTRMKHTDQIQNLKNAEGVDKMRELVDHNSICMFGTIQNNKLHTRPMSVQEVDDDGNLWLLSGRESQKNADLKVDPTVQLFFSNPGDAEFLAVTGTAEVLSDKERIEELWNPIAKAWFTKGKDDPSLTVIKVTPDESYYWDTQHGKMVSMIKFVAGAVTGQKVNEGVKGRIQL